MESTKALKKQYANYMNAPSDYQSSHPPNCGCPTPMKRLQVQSRASDNIGKWFYACPKGKHDETQCDIFLWVSLEKAVEKGWSVMEV